MNWRGGCEDSGEKKCSIKIHLAIDASTKEIIAMDVAPGDVDDSEALPSLVKNASKHKIVAKAYDILSSMNIVPIIRPRKNARTDKGLLGDKGS